MGKRRVVLFVDDDHLVREIVVSLIESAEAYDVIGASSFDSAAAYLAEPGAVDVLVTDFRLSRARSGLELCEMAVNLNADIALVLISAESSDEVKLRPIHAAFLQKPFGRVDLLRAIEVAVSEVSEA